MLLLCSLLYPLGRSVEECERDSGSDGNEEWWWWSGVTRAGWMTGFHSCCEVEVRTGGREDGEEDAFTLSLSPDCAKREEL